MNLLQILNEPEKTKSKFLFSSDCSINAKSAAWPTSSERRFYDGHDRKVDGSTPTQDSLLRPWIRCSR